MHKMRQRHAARVQRPYGQNPTATRPRLRGHAREHNCRPHGRDTEDTLAPAISQSCSWTLVPGTFSGTWMGNLVSLMTPSSNLPYLISTPAPAVSPVHLSNLLISAPHLLELWSSVRGPRLGSLMSTPSTFLKVGSVHASKDIRVDSHSPPSSRNTTPLWHLLTDWSPAPVAHDLSRLIVANCTQLVLDARAQPSWPTRSQSDITLAPAISQPCSWTLVPETFPGT